MIRLRFDVGICIDLPINKLNKFQIQQHLAMKLTQAFQILLVSSASYAITESTSIDVDKIKNNECGNSVSFSSSFQTGTGEECSECSFCGGANLNALFNPNIASTCIECAKENTKCTSFRVVTAFNKPWLMEFFSLTSSDETSDT